MDLAEDIEYKPEQEGFIERCISNNIFKDYILGRLSWKQSDGTFINLSDMSEEHIKNCLRIPLYPNKKEWDLIFKWELDERRKCRKVL